MTADSSIDSSINSADVSSSDSADEADPQAERLPQMLRFEIIPSTYALLPLTQFAEVLKIPLGQIVPIPHMPAYVMGAYNWRGTVLWTIDLGYLMGMTPCHQYQGARSTHTTLVIEYQDKSSTTHQLGMVIHDVTNSVEVDPDVITAAELSNLPPTLTQFLSGYWVDNDGDMLAVLNNQAIFKHMPSSTP